MLPTTGILIRWLQIGFTFFSYFFVTTFPRHSSKRETNVMNDQDLIKQVLRGQRQAFAQLVDRYKDYVFTVVLRLVKNREEAEEIAMDVFMKVHKNLKHFHGKSKFSTWLYSIAYRTSVDYLRVKKRPVVSLDQEEVPWQIPDSTSQGPMQKLQAGELSREINLLIQGLGANDAALISLFYLQEQNIDEIATITGLSKSNVKVRLFRIRQKLKEVLEKTDTHPLKDWL